MIDQNHNLFKQFQLQFDAHAQDELLRDSDEQSFSYNDVLHRSGQIANALCSLGAKPGDRISTQVEKSVEGLCLYLACLRAGLVLIHRQDPSVNNDERGLGHGYFPEHMIKVCRILIKLQSS